jgi:hypothetical protein
MLDLLVSCSKHFTSELSHSYKRAHILVYCRNILWNWQTFTLTGIYQELHLLVYNATR